MLHWPNTNSAKRYLARNIPLNVKGLLAGSACIAGALSTRQTSEPYEAGYCHASSYHRIGNQYSGMIDEPPASNFPHISPAMNCLVNTGFNFYHYKSLDTSQQQLMTEVPEKIGLNYAATPQEALDKAFEILGSGAKVTVLRSAAEMIPVCK